MKPDVLDRQVLSDALHEEWQAWNKTHKAVDALGRVDYPVLLDEGGLPPRWHARAVDQYMSRNLCPAVMCLVSRDGGGWMLVEQEDGYVRSSWVVLYGTSLDDVHDTLCDLSDSEESIRKFGPAEMMVNRFIADFYDATIPDEAAEQMLVGLGARPRLLPAALP